MGTSGSSRGTGNGSSLIPTFLDEPAGKPLPSEAVSPGNDGGGDGAGGAPESPRPAIPAPAEDNRFSSARRNFSVFAGSGGSDTRALRRAVRDYVRTGYGSSGNATRAMGSSRATAAGVLDVLRSFTRDGVAQTLARFNLSGLAGRPAAEILTALTDILCEDGGTIDEAIARDAWLEAVASVEDAGIVDLDGMIPDQLSEVFLAFISHSIQSKLFQEIGVNGFRVADLDEIRAFESQFRSYVDGRVRDAFSADLSGIGTMSDDRIRSIVEQTYRDAWEVFITWGDSA
ncbi:MAG: Qat anti-phage system associated protein QatB [Devosia marina]|uniref:Qat anti-phage system associated protein QatB n=1 Tax=Devosia marina TaxID=2683198 RepID=UPI0032EFDD1D